MYIPIEFSVEELERLALLMDEGETWSEAVRGIVLMVMDDLEAIRAYEENAS